MYACIYKTHIHIAAMNQITMTKKCEFRYILNKASERPHQCSCESSLDGRAFQEREPPSQPTYVMAYRRSQDFHQKKLTTFF